MLASVIRGLLAPEMLCVPPECGVVAITRIDVSADSSYATVYVSALSESQTLLAYLQSRLPHYQKIVARGIVRWRAPSIRFRIDESIERGNAIDRLLGQS